GLSRGRSGFGVEQRHQTVGSIQRGQVIVAAYMGLAYVDLRHGAPARAFHHDGTLLGILVDADLLDFGHAALFEQHFSAYAIRAHGGAIHCYGSHSHLLINVSWIAACRHESTLTGPRSG